MLINKIPLKVYDTTMDKDYKVNTESYIAK